MPLPTHPHAAAFVQLPDPAIRFGDIQRPTTEPPSPPPSDIQNWLHSGAIRLHSHAEYQLFGANITHLPSLLESHFFGHISLDQLIPLLSSHPSDPQALQAAIQQFRASKRAKEVAQIPRQPPPYGPPPPPAPPDPMSPHLQPPPPLPHSPGVPVPPPDPSNAPTSRSVTTTFPSFPHIEVPVPDPTPRSRTPRRDTDPLFPTLIPDSHPPWVQQAGVTPVGAPGTAPLRPPGIAVDPTSDPFFFFFLIAGCIGSLGYWQSLATRESNKQYQWYCVPKESQVPIHYDLSHHNLCMTERMVHKREKRHNNTRKTKARKHQPPTKPTPTTKHKTIASTEVRREGETVLTRSVLLLQQIAQ